MNELLKRALRGREGKVVCGARVVLLALHTPNSWEPACTLDPGHDGPHDVNVKFWNEDMEPPRGVSV